MNSVTLRCQVNAEGVDPSIGFRISLDGQEIFSLESAGQIVDFSYDLDDNDAEHQLEFSMFGKTQEHTIVDEQGNIVKDSMINVGKITVDEIDITQVVYDQAVYEHNFNGTQAALQDKFYGDMGCNGTVSLRFTTPIYLWLLENM